MSLVLSGDTGVQGNSGAFVAGTAVASTSGTSIDFTSIPSWVKRITVMFNDVSTNGTSNKLIQIGASSVTSTGYVSSGGGFSGSGQAVATSTSGYVIQSDSAATGVTGNMIINLISGNIWVSSHSASYSTTAVATGGGTVSLSGSLDRVRITTVNGTDTFDAGSINILYE